LSVINVLLNSLIGVNSEKLTPEKMGDLLSAEHHSPLLSRRRALVILSRIRLLALLGAFFYVVGIFIDAFYFDDAVFQKLVIYRCGAAALFIILFLGVRNADSLQSAYRAMFIFFATNLLFQSLYQPLVLPDYFQSISDLATVGYAIFPFMIAASISIFPLSIKEVFLVNVLFFTAELLIITIASSHLNPQPGLGILVSLISAIGLCSFSAISQLSYMLSLVEQASIDGLTHCFSRNSGEEILDVQFRIAARQDAPLAVIFLDLDDFKEVNDRYGHEAGDKVLAAAADNIRQNLRDSDILIRWGGEEFLMLLPHTDSEGASRAVRRMRNNGFGKRPNGLQLTASMGIVEMHKSGAKHWQELVEFADAQMYLAKTSGKDNYSIHDPEKANTETA
jgi:diguanylate cyclase (GGDEF)-like protein